MVGLRWWSQIKDDGSEDWVFESIDESKTYFIYSIYSLAIENKSDSRVFWVSTYGTPVLWIIFVIVSVLSFKIQNITICVFGFMLSNTNLVFYIKCSKDHKKKLQGFLIGQAKQRLTVQQVAKIGEFAIKQQLA